MLRMFVRRNELRRSSDRIEGVVVALLMGAFVAAVITAVLVGAHVYRSEQTTAASLRPTVAVLSSPGAVAETPILHEATAMATWRTSDGAARTGLLTTDVAPGIYGEPAGAAVQLWLGRSGDPAAPPQGAAGMAVGAVMAGLAVVVVAATVLTFCYRLCQRGLDRRRIANWSSAWAITGPRWTSRQ
jgi:uncharacterized membrane protein YraQ (UPF0718 family)